MKRIREWLVLALFIPVAYGVRFWELCKRYLGRERSWPFLLIGEILTYYLLPREYWQLLTFVLLGMFYLLKSVDKALEYFFLQGKFVTLLYAFANLIFGIALIGSALVVSPYPVIDFSNLRQTVRSIWAIALPFFSIVVYIETWWTYDRIKENSE